MSLSENIDTTTATGELAFHMIGAFAQFDEGLSQRAPRSA